MEAINEIQEVINTYNIGILTESETIHQITAICIKRLNETSYLPYKVVIE